MQAEREVVLVVEGVVGCDYTVVVFVYCLAGWLAGWLAGYIAQVCGYLHLSSKHISRSYHDGCMFAQYEVVRTGTHSRSRCT